MNVYISHSAAYDYEHELYEPIRGSDLPAKCSFFLPHETDNKGVYAKDIIRSTDLLIAEVSYPATGQGIELGWADAFGRPIACIYRKGMKYSGSLRFVADQPLAYENKNELIALLRHILTQ